MAATIRLHSRTWTSSRQFEHGQCPTQLLLPIGKLAFKWILFLKPLSLPIGEIHVMHLKGLQRHGPAGTDCIIAGKQLAVKYRDRPCIADNVVHERQEDMLLFI